MNGIQRFVTNRTNHINAIGALLTPNSVRSIEGAVLQKPVGRLGSGSISLFDAYLGTEEATYDFKVVDTNPVDAPLLTTPVFTGKGSGSLTALNFTAGPLTTQKFTVELNDLGAILRSASVNVFDSVIKAFVAGAAGNDFNLKVIRSGLVFTPQAYSLLNDLRAGTSSASGSEYDWDAKLLQGDGTIPLSAHRITFGNDVSNIYLQYSSRVNGVTEYNFIPAIKQDVPAGTIVNYVTGNYSVQLYDVAVLVNTYTGIVTLYDLLDQIKQDSFFLTVDTIVAYDRTPSGDASLELPFNTDAYVQRNGGTGSSFTTGFTDVTITPNAPTELVTATCFAASNRDDATAGLGRELWRVEGSVSGLIAARVVSGGSVSTATYEFTIPVRVPTGFVETRRGTFEVSSIRYVTRDVLENAAPPVCPHSLTLGVNAADQTLTLVYTKRPRGTGDCDCDTFPGASFDPSCLGLDGLLTTGGINMAYQADTVTRLTDLYTWFAGIVRTHSAYLGLAVNANGVQEPFISQPYDVVNPFPYALTNFQKQSLFELVARFETVVGNIDKLPAGAPRVAGMAAWDIAIVELKADILALFDIPAVPAVPAPPTSEVVAGGAYEALVAGDAVVIFDDFGVTKVAKASIRPNAIKYGLVLANYAVGAAVTVHFTGDFGLIIANYQRHTDGSDLTETLALPIGTPLFMSRVTPGKWAVDGVTRIGAIVVNSAIAAGFSLTVTSNGVAPYYVIRAHIPAIPAIPAGIAGYALNLLTDRYRSRMMQTLISAGISPLGKLNANDPDSGDGCWLDDPTSTYFWAITGSVGGGYAPVFSNTPYVSSKYQAGQVVDGNLVPQTKGYYSTKEFAFILDVKCPQNLKEGDTVVLSIGNAAYPATYQVGDKLVLEVVAAKNVSLSGGTDGDNVQTWNVTGSVAGGLNVYLYNPAVPVDYNSGNGLLFGFIIGAIPFDKGDRFEFSVEGGHYQARVNGGAWGAVNTITDAAFLLSTPLPGDTSGLSGRIFRGASPSFATNDIYSFKALQPYALSNIKRPGFKLWEWDVAIATQRVDFSANVTLDTLAIAFHTLPLGATIRFQGSTINYAGDPGSVFAFDETLAAVPGAFAKFFTLTQTARYMVITITGAPNGGIGWMFAGTADKFTRSAECLLSLRYQANKSSTDFNPTAYFKGKGVGAQVVFPDGTLLDTDFDVLIAMLDGLKMNNNEAFIFSPQVTRPEVYAVTLDTDSVDVSDVYQFQPNIGINRRMSASLSLAPVYTR